MPDTLRLAGALLPPHTHDDLLVAIRESDGEVMAAASVLDFGAGLDVTEGPSGEANIALDLTEAIWTFAQGGFRFRDGAGPLLSTGASGDDLFLVGDLDVSGHLAVGSLAGIQANEGLRIQETFASGGSFQARGLFVTVDNTGAGVGPFVGGGFFAEHKGASSRTAIGLFGQATTSATADGSSVEGLNFAASAHAGACRVAEVAGVKVAVQSYGQTGEVVACYGLKVVGYWSGAKPTTAEALYIGPDFAPSGVGTAYGLHCADLQGSVAVRLLEIGPATPYLRLVGGTAPAANQTNLYLYEGSTPALRQVQWKAGNALGAGDRVLV